MAAAFLIRMPQDKLQLPPQPVQAVRLGLGATVEFLSKNSSYHHSNVTWFLTFAFVHADNAD